MGVLIHKSGDDAEILICDVKNSVADRMEFV